MTNYDFAAALSAIDFELLSKDLLDAELGIRLENFREGRDKGIDLRYAPFPQVHTTASLRAGLHLSTPTIVQCKRYATFSSLKSALKNKELPKIARLNPPRYILTTSASLSPQQADEIKELLSPYVHSTGDIYGKERLNSLLEKHPEVERRHIKLWISSAGVLDSFLNARTHIVSREEVERTIASAKIYVKNPSFDEALEILKKHRVCIISGLPGIGKTTLARMLLLYFHQHDFDVIKIESDISEARTAGYHSRPRFYLYDDFLGQTGQADKLKKNEDQKLLDFMSSVKSSKQSVLVMTTREYILNQARLNYEKLARERFDYRTCIIDLSKYSRRIRAQILYNHLHFSELPRTHLDDLVSQRGHIRIIDHKNYNPRLIEHLTSPSWIAGTPSHEYLNLFLQTLDNPVLIWEHAFRNQLSERARHLLYALVTLPPETRLIDAEQAFIRLHELQSNRYGMARRVDDYNMALKELDGTFVFTWKAQDTTLIRLQNPSIRDFMKNLLLGGEFLEAAVESSVFFEQPQWFMEILGGGEPNVSLGALPSHRRLLLDTMQRLINAPSCSITVDSYGQYRRVALQDANQAARVAAIAAATSAAGRRQDDTFVEAQLEYMAEALRARVIRPDSCLTAIGTLEDLGHLSTSPGQKFVQALKDRVVDQPTELEDFEVLTQVIDAFPESFEEAELDDIRQEYMAFATQYAQDCAAGEWDINDPEVIREEALRLDHVGKQLDLDTEEAQEMINDFADDKEQDAEARRDWERDDDEYHGRGGNAETCTDDELNSMFGTLRE